MTHVNHRAIGHTGHTREMRPVRHDRSVVSAVPEGIIANIGHTPLIKISKIAHGLPLGVEVYAKGEHLNPSGSVKDRAAYAIIRDALRRGTLTAGKIILDATSGNTGIAYAMIGSALGYRVTVCLPANASVERKRILRAYGAEIIETDRLEGTDGAQSRVKILAAQSPEKYFYADQYNNDANWRAHFETTAPEIWQQTGGRITHFIAALGTSGTFVGTTRRLKELKPALRAIAVQPDTPLHGLEGMKHMATAVVPGIYDPSVADEQVEISTEDAQNTCRLLAQEEGLFVGMSSGANVFAALRLARMLPKRSVVVTILCDTGTRYLNESFWEGTIG
jgi:S-sulfo-L-cysteine synthase (O-acetyl-L-serine-dependent)